MAAPFGRLAIHRALLVCAVGIALLSPSAVLADDAIYVTVENTTGFPAADLHVTFAGTGGNIYVDPLSVHAMDCPTPAVTSNPPVVTATAVIDWGTECVAPGNFVTFIARTAVGPLSVTAAFWTNDVGAAIGPGPWDEDPIPPPPPPNPFAALKFWADYVGGAKTYTLYRWNEDQFWRTCCRSARWCFVTTYFCLVDSRFGLLFELGAWQQLGPRVHSGFSKGSWRDEWLWLWFWGLPHEKCTPPVPPTWMPFGPPPSGHGDVRFKMYDPKDYGLDVRYSDNYGYSWRQGTDFTATFQTVAESLLTYRDSQGPLTPPLYTRAQILTQIGHRYSALPGVLAPLITEVNNTRIAEPNPLLDDVYQDLTDVQTSTGAIGALLLPGTAGSSTPFLNLSQALGRLASDIDNVSPSPRYDNAARHLSQAATLAADASHLVAAGLSDSVSAARFGSIMRGQMQVQMQQFAQAMWPHICIQARVCDYSWNPSTIDAAWVIMQNLDVGTPPDTLALRISDHGEFYIPTMGLYNGTRLRIRFKLPTYLSVSFDVNYYDGLHVGPLSLVGGDANNDDCISLIDLALVGADQGDGGYGWPTSVSTADVTGDGKVDQMDVQVLQYNYTKCGPRITGAEPVRPPSLVRLQAFPNPTEGMATIRFELSEEAPVTIRLYNVRGQQVAIIANHRYPAGQSEVRLGGTDLPSGIYMCRMTASLPGRGPEERVTKLTILK